MMNYIIALLFLVTNTVHARTYTTVKAEIMDGVLAPRNYVLNHEFEVNDRNVTDASNIASRTTTQPLSGGASLEIDATASAQVVKFALRSFDRGLNGKNCEAFFTYHRDASLYKIYVEQNSVAVSGTATQLENVPIAGGRKTPSLFFPCGDNTYTTYVVIESTDNAADVIKVDEFYAGQAVNIGTVQQARHVGSIKYAGNASCTWSTTSTSWANFAADTDCSTPTVSGIVTAPGTKIPALVLGSAPPGVYQFVAKGSFNNASVGNSSFRFYDGTNASAAMVVGDQGAVKVPNLIGEIAYTSPQSNVTVNIQGLASSTMQIQADVSGTRDLQVDVYYFPSQSQQAVSMAQTNYDWTAYTPTFTNMGTVTITDAKDCLHKKHGSDLLIQCRFNNGTGSAAEARVSLPGSLTTSSTKIATLRTAGTFSQNSAEAFMGTMLLEPSKAYLTFGKQGAGTGGVAKLNGNSMGAANYSFEARVPIEGWVENQNAPAVVGGVTSSYTDVLKIETVNFGGASEWSNCTSSPCTIYQQTGKVSSVTRTSGGIYVVNWATGTWSARPSCSVQSMVSGSFNVICNANAPVSGGAMTINCGQPGTAAGDTGVSITCIGPR